MKKAYQAIESSETKSMTASIETRGENSDVPTGKVKLYRMSTPEHECPWGLRAFNLLNDKDIDFEDIKLTTPEEVSAFKARNNVTTTPQIFFGDGTPSSDFRPADLVSSRMISMHNSTHSSQMNTVGPAISLRTSC